MVKSFAILALLIKSVFALAQLTVLVKEDFSDNHLGWYEDKDEHHSAQIINGRYEVTVPSSGWLTYIYPLFDEQKDFSFEARFTQLEGNAENGFGFVWGYDEQDGMNVFVVSSSGHAKVWTSDALRKDAKEWKRTDAVMPMGIPNVLRIEQQKGILKFTVNEHELFSMEALPWYGKNIGFIAYTKMHLVVDDFILKSNVKINLPEDLPTGLVKENLGSGVNSEYDEVTPKISADGKVIYFTRKYSPDNSGGIQDASDIWYSETADGIKWSKSKNIGSPLNTQEVNNIVAVGQDNNTMLLVAANDFEFFERTVDGWKSNGMLGIRYENEHNYFEASQSMDGKTILLAVKSKNNLFYQANNNEKDIYVIRKGTDGKWNAPVNLGPVINTTGNEASPVLAADGRTLYFASDGHPGYGGLDLFMSKRLDDSWTSWTAPVNLGPEINTYGFDAYFTLPASGDVAYLCTAAGGFGKSDIVRIALPQSLRPDPVVLVKGSVLNARTNQPLQAHIVFEDFLVQHQAGDALSNPVTGEYRVVLPYGTTYGLLARADGYLSVNESVELTGDSSYVELIKDLYLVSIEVGETVILNNVFFEQGKAALKPESYPELDRLFAIMQENPTLEIELSGHTDNIGKPSGLRVLSKARVDAVKDYLVKKGIATSRITGKGYGGSKPLQKNDSDANRKSNRRVEIKVMKK
ncbi:MAG: OmpA family protein [Cyclobacteriaceae bacterium]|nr:OmpA family protein [Cyclobacteriaceae bacterium]